ncbi:fimbrillin family protein [Bacteroides sp. AN502(2024)]|uniref:fimbrillin family protein n=1 Tax=Bacteroides sp. AN502(2024) TaxID=3160599 RepID=UPI00351692E8
MKLFCNQQKVVGLLVLYSILLSACVNHISEEEADIVNNGNIPLKFIADIRGAVGTRMANNHFDEGDEVGLFALAGATTMQEERYVDNLRFVRSSNGEFESNESVYYPDDGATLNLISYYPYQTSGVGSGESTMQVAVSTTQNVADDYSHSDFLVASKEDVLASKEAVALTYNHQFFRLKIVLTPGEEENLEDMLSVKPTLSVSGFYTKTNYDFQKRTFSGYSEEKDIVPAGEWEIKDGRLIGKECILVPQEATPGYQYITLEVAGKLYISMLPATLQLISGKQRELEIQFVSAEDVLMSKVNGEIGDWDGTEVDHTESVALHKYIDVSKLTFERSNVYKVLHSGKQVAEICMEYLVTSAFSSQAIVVYPMKEDGSVNLSQGVVVQLLGKSGTVNGGSVSWNVEEHSLTYVDGTLPIRNNVYVMADGTVSLSVTTADDVLSVLALEDIVRDVRGGVIHNYPLVKIGTQYWMRDNLEASLYTDGEMLPKLDAVAANATGYLQSFTGNYYFYTADVALSGRILPTHWNIPNWEDWNLLKEYLKGDVSLIKSGTWLPLKTEEPVQPATNLSGFNGMPIGMYVGIFQSDYEKKHLGYWTLDNTNTEIAPTVFYIKSSTNIIEESNAGVGTKAFAIRCIRK